jgi:hypothetical protein
MSESGEDAAAPIPPPGPWATETASAQAQWSAPGEAGPAWAASPDGSGSSFSSGPQPLYVQRPEILIGAAFVGGLLLAMLLKRLAR